MYDISNLRVNKYMDKPIFLYQIINTVNTLLRVIISVVARIFHS